MEEIIKSLQQVCNEVWKNYKHHTEEFDQANSGKFWEDWVDDICLMDAAYRNDPIKYALYVDLVKGLVNATEKGLKNAKETS